MKKILTAMLAAILTATALTGCQSGGFDPASDITVISREDGSGTRGAFVELMGIEEKGADGSKTDRTTKEAVILNSTDVVLQSVAGDPYAIGYVSLGSLNDSVKAVSIDSVAASAEAVKNGSYPVARPFFIATKGTPNEVAQDFIRFILSSDGQSVVSGSCIPVSESAQPFSGSSPSGKCVIAGSSSVSPVMEKLMEAYQAVNPGAVLELQTNDSTAGMTAAINGTCDIGMASRALKESEAAELTPTQIALDGIAVVINQQNPVANLTSDEVRSIYIGETLSWEAFAE